ncbi:hypothetical protein BC832DRAFT_596108 [Gaertneriomyces semiglobifer]|nr:hypothetical protein BC832DRAFT_596108 [Gaertneriomyces semiglobifer]
MPAKTTAPSLYTAGTHPSARPKKVDAQPTDLTDAGMEPSDAGSQKPKRVLTEEQKQKMKESRERKKQEKLEAEAREQAEKDRLAKEELERQLQEQAKKEAILAKRREARQLKKQQQQQQSSASSSVQGDASSTDTDAAAPDVEKPDKGKGPAKNPRKRKTSPVNGTGDNHKPPGWFEEFITSILREQEEQKGAPVNKRQIQEKGKEHAEVKWHDGYTRERVRGAVDNHVSQMYKMIFG